MTQALREQLLKRAVHLLGIDEIAKRLDVRPERVQAWIDGLAVIPEPAFLKLVDLLAQEDK